MCEVGPLGKTSNLFDVRRLGEPDQPSGTIANYLDAKKPLQLGTTCQLVSRLQGLDEVLGDSCLALPERDDDIVNVEED